MCVFFLLWNNERLNCCGFSQSHKNCPQGEMRIKDKQIRDRKTKRKTETTCKDMPMYSFGLWTISSHVGTGITLSKSEWTFCIWKDLLHLLTIHHSQFPSFFNDKQICYNIWCFKHFNVFVDVNAQCVSEYVMFIHRELNFTSQRCFRAEKYNREECLLKKIDVQKYFSVTTMYYLTIITEHNRLSVDVSVSCYWQIFKYSAW